MNKEMVIESYEKSQAREIILKMPQGKKIDEIIQEYLKMAIAEGGLKVVEELKL